MLRPSNQRSHATTVQSTAPSDGPPSSDSRTRGECSATCTVRCAHTLIVQPPTQPAHGPLGPGRTGLRHQLKSPTGMAQKFGRSDRLWAPFEPLDWLNRFQSMMASRGKGRWDGSHRFQRRVGTATLCCVFVLSMGLLGPATESSRQNRQTSNDRPGLGEPGASSAPRVMTCLWADVLI